MTATNACVYAGNRAICLSASILHASTSVCVIPAHEFEGWNNLVEINFSNATNLTVLQSHAFMACKNVETLILPPNVVEIAESCFESCSSIQKVHFPASLKLIGRRAFIADGICELTADPNIAITGFSEYSFYRTRLETFDVWKSLETIDAVSFAGSPLLNYTNSQNNTNFQVIDGVLYQGTTLVGFPGGLAGSFVVPAFVEVLGPHCFDLSRLSNVSFAPHSRICSFTRNAFTESKLTFFQFPDSQNATAIGSYMFYQCKQLQRLVITNSINQIGTMALYGSGIREFQVATDHPTFTLLNGVLFSKDLSTLVASPPALPVDQYEVPKCVTTVKDSAFASVKFNITFEGGSQLKAIGAWSFNAISQPVFMFDRECPLKEIPGFAFSSARVERIEFPKGLVKIDGTAFRFTQISEFSMPSGATDMTSRDGVLYSLDMSLLFRFPPKKAGDFVTPKEVKIIGNYAFATCSMMNELRFEMDSLLTTVRDHAFEQSSITSVVFPQNGETVSIELECFKSSSVRSVTLPGKMKTVKADMFKDCTSLVEIKLPDCVEKIESNAFLNCQSLTSVEINQYAPITAIPANAFAGTRSLTSISLPFQIRSVAKLALPPNLQHVTLYCPPTTQVVQALEWLPFLTQIDILCNYQIDTSSFVSTGIVIRYICESRNQIPFKYRWSIDTSLVFLLI